MDFISRLLDFIFPPRDTERLVREVSLEQLVSYIAPTNVPKYDFEVTSLFPFHTPIVRALIHEAKYRGNTYAQELLGRSVAEYLTERHLEEMELRGSKYVLVPIPLSRSRMHERGFNQCEVILEKALENLPTGFEDIFTLKPEILSRIRDTEHQTFLTKKNRESNLIDAFLAPTTLDATANYLIFDDVLTTGATLNSAIRTLMAAGARNVSPFTIAH